MKCKIVKAAMYAVEDYHNGVMEIDEYTKWCLKSAKNGYTEFLDSIYDDILECSLLFKKEDIDTINKYYDPCENNLEVLNDCYDFDEESIRKSLRRFYDDENELTELLMDENSLIIISDKDCYYHE